MGSSKKSKHASSYAKSKKSKSNSAGTNNHPSTSYSNAITGTSNHNHSQSPDGYSIDRYIEDPINANPEYSHSTVDDSVHAHAYSMEAYLHEYEAATTSYKG